MHGLLEKRAREEEGRGIEEGTTEIETIT